MTRFIFFSQCVTLRTVCFTIRHCSQYCRYIKKQQKINKAKRKNGCPNKRCIERNFFVAIQFQFYFICFAIYSLERCKHDGIRRLIANKGPRFLLLWQMVLSDISFTPLFFTFCSLAQQRPKPVRSLISIIVVSSINEENRT